MRHSATVGATVLGLAAGCTPALAPPSTTNAELDDADRATENAALAIDETRCQEGRGRLQPFVVSWDATAQAELAAHAQESLAVVKMTGCSLELLPTCRVPGEYRFRKTSGNLQSLEVLSQDDLYAKLPLSVLQLSGKVGQKKALRLRYFVRGLHYATAPTLYRSQLSPECQGATHFVLNFAAGAFELNVARGSEQSGGAEVLGAGAGARHEDARRVVYRGGDVAACSNGSECDAPVRLRLLPIVAGAPPADTREVAALAVTKPALAEATPADRTKADVAQTVRSSYPGFRACYHDLLGRGVSTNTEIETHFTIEPDGVVSKLDLVVKGTSDPAFTECLREVLYSVRFVPAKARAQVIYPIKFAPK